MSAEEPVGTGPEEPVGTGPEEPVGSLAEEAAKLFAAIGGLGQPGGTSAREQRADLRDDVIAWGDRLASAIRDVDEHLATGGAECRYCPVCRAVDLVRRTDPDVAQHLLDAARSVSRAVAAALATDTVEGSRGRTRRDAGVEHIDLDGDVALDDEDAPSDGETGPSTDEEEQP